jgi:hypothetical protein
MSLGICTFGHALTDAVQDKIILYQRIMCRDALYLPGTDHAGIATQVVVECWRDAIYDKSIHVSVLQLCELPAQPGPLLQASVHAAWCRKFTTK